MNLSPEQTLAVTSPAVDKVIVAGPGSGKTRTLIESIRHALATGTDPRRVTVLTFTNAAANEILSRLAEDGSPPPLAYCGTLHGCMMRLLSAYGPRIGLAPRLAVLDEEATGELLAEIMLAQRSKCALKNVRRAVVEVGRWFGRQAAEHRLSPEELIAAAYHDMMVREGLVDYDSILTHGLRLLNAWDAVGDHPPAVKMERLFVDEYQDSGPMDALIYRAFPAAAKLFVGDPDQSIYGFRGADVSGMVRHCSRPGVGVFKLETNYRCAREICEQANALIAFNEERVDKLTKPDTDEAGEVECWTNLPTAAHEQAVILRDIATKGVPPEDIAILCRSNNLVEQMAKAVESAGLPLSRRAVERLPEDWPVVRMAVGFLCDPFNNHLCRTLATRHFGPQMAQAFYRAALRDGDPMFRKCFAIPDAPGREDLGRLLIGVFRASPESVERLARAGADLPADAPLSELALSLARIDTKGAQDGHGVTVTTMHAAKGREWHTVYLPAFEMGVIPSGAKNADLSEERRLAYVAVTRAKRRLVLSAVNVRANAFTNKPEAMRPSRFLNEMGWETTAQ